MSEHQAESGDTHCQERSPVTGLPCTRRAEHHTDDYGGLCMSGDGNSWTSDPWQGDPESDHIEPHEHDAAGCLDCDCFAGPPNSVSCTCPPDAESDLASRREEPDGAHDHRWQVTTPEEGLQP